MLLRRPPSPALAPYVECLWAFDQTAERWTPRATRERALPTGDAHLVFRLSNAPVRVFEEASARSATCFGHAVVTGARSAYYVRDVSQPSCSVGAHFRPGGAAALLGVPANELAEKHTALADLWGRSAEAALGRLHEARTAPARLDRLEALLLARLPARTPMHPIAACALEHLGARGAVSIARLVRESGASHRRFLEVFRSAVGLTPKVYARVRRFQRALARIAHTRGGDLARIALDCGYFDQPHLTREFRSFAGIPPGELAPVSPDRPNHVAEPVRREGAKTYKRRAGAPS